MSKIVVVEGTHDEALIKQVFKGQACIVTNGSEISKETLEMISSLSKDNDIIVFTGNDIVALGLTGSNSSPLREAVSSKLNIGRPNAKTFLNRVNMLGITVKKLNEIVGEINGKNR